MIIAIKDAISRSKLSILRTKIRAIHPYKKEKDSVRLSGAFSALTPLLNN